jgi:hypothetical protein
MWSVLWHGFEVSLCCTLRCAAQQANLTWRAPHFRCTSTRTLKGLYPRRLICNFAVPANFRTPYSRLTHLGHANPPRPCSPIEHV